METRVRIASDVWDCGLNHWQKVVLPDILRKKNVVDVVIEHSKASVALGPDFKVSQKGPLQCNSPSVLCEEVCGRFVMAVRALVDLVRQSSKRHVEIVRRLRPNGNDGFFDFALIVQRLHNRRGRVSGSRSQTYDADAVSVRAQALLRRLEDGDVVRAEVNAIRGAQAESVLDHVSIHVGSTEERTALLREWVCNISSGPVARCHCR